MRIKENKQHKKIGYEYTTTFSINNFGTLELWNFDF